MFSFSRFGSKKLNFGPLDIFSIALIRRPSLVMNSRSSPLSKKKRVLSSRGNRKSMFVVTIGSNTRFCCSYSFLCDTLREHLFSATAWFDDSHSSQEAFVMTGAFAPWDALMTVS